MSSAKTSVADQPAMMIFTIGFSIALLLGLVFRALLAPEVVKQWIDSAAQGVHQDVEFQISRAYFGLADGFWPQFAVVVEDFSVLGKNPCWLQPEARVNRMELPISLTQLLVGKIEIHRIRIDHVDLTLHAQPKDCQGPHNSSIHSNSPSQLFAQSQDNDPRHVLRSVAQSFPVATNGPGHSATTLKRLTIQSMQVNYLPLSGGQFRIEKFDLRLLNPEPRQIEASAMLLFGGENFLGDYNSTAKMELRYHEVQPSPLTVNVRGAWREGEYVLAAQSTKEKLSWELQARHLPFNEITPLAKKHGVLENSLSPKQAWVSFQAGSDMDLKNPAGSSGRIRNLKIEGDIGLFETPVLEWNRLDPVDLKPFEVVLRGVNSRELLEALGAKKIPSSLGELGSFNGKLLWKNPQDIWLEGEHSGLEFIFSNKGERETQILSLILLDAHYLNGHLVLDFKRIKPLEGFFEGKVRLEHDFQQQMWQAVVDIDELILAPNVQKLMSGGGEIGALYGQIEARYQRGILETLKSRLTLSKGQVEGIKINRLKLEAEGRPQVGYSINVNWQEADFEKNELATNFLNPLIQVTKNTGPSVILKSGHLQVMTQDFKAVAWKFFDFSIAGENFRSEGSWDSSGNLTGRIRRKSSAQPVWSLSGHRDDPVLESSRSSL